VFAVVTVNESDFLEDSLDNRVIAVTRDDDADVETADVADVGRCVETTRGGDGVSFVVVVVAPATDLDDDK
jgi:hypothetical protein